MTAFWQYFWPVFAAGLISGAVAGLIGFRRGRARRAMLLGAGAALAAALLWHGPLGGANRFSTAVERNTRQVLVDWEMGAVTARLERGPLTRRLELSGPADAFQRGELVKLVKVIPGVGSATWSKDRALPLAAEGALAALLGFLVGLVLTYVVELRRRHNAQWNW